MIRRLVVAVAAMREPFALVIDHVEVIQDVRCGDAIAELALNLPVGSRLALASRIEPPIPVARLRAQGLVVDIGVDDLAMDRDEASELLAAAEVVLTEDELTDLVQRTEGWAVGLYLASLAAKADGARAQATLAFHGDDRLMADYLRSEVLARRSPATAAFLTRTSVLDSMSGPLCDAVLERQGSQQVLESLERSILLLVPLDRSREWYRYHHLLRDLLRAELQRSEPELVPRLHDRAAAWFEANGRPDLAIDYAQAAGDADRAAHLFAGIAQLTYAAGRLDTALRWLGWFEFRGLIERYPQVAVEGAICEALLGHPTSAERWADAAASGSFDGVLPDGSPLESWIALLEAGLCRRGAGRMRADADLACERLAPGSPWSGPALHLAAMARVLDGDGDAGDPPPGPLDRGLPPHGHHADRAGRAGRAGRPGDRTRRLERRWGVRVGGVGDRAGRQPRRLRLRDRRPRGGRRVAVHRRNVAQAQEQVVPASRLRPLCSEALPLSTRFLLQLAHAYVELSDPAGARAVLRQIRDILRVRPDVGDLSERADELQQMVDAIHLGAVGASSLTAAELRLLPLLATHLSYTEIGDRLYVSRNTVKSHAVSIFRKLGVSSRSAAIQHAEEVGLLGR
jgi:LuxR family maltose regulon positive regulatory protein